MKHQTHHDWVKPPPYVQIWDSVGTFLDPSFTTFHFALKHSFSVFTSFSYVSLSIKLPFTVQFPLCFPRPPHPATQTQHPWLRIKKDNTQRGLTQCFCLSVSGRFRPCVLLFYGSKSFAME